MPVSPKVSVPEMFPPPHVVSGIHQVGDRPAPGVRGRRRLKGGRQTEEKGRQDDRRGDHGEASYVKHTHTQGFTPEMAH